MGWNNGTSQGCGIVCPPVVLADDRLINAFAHYLPDLNATFSIFDQPQIYLSWARRASLASLGLKNQRMCP